MDHFSNSPPGSSSSYAAAILKDERTLGTRLTTSFFIRSRHPLPSDQTPKVWRSRRKSLSLLPIFFISQVPLTVLTILTAGFWRAAARTMCVDKDVMYVRTTSSVVPENAAEISVVQRTAAIARPVGDVVSESAARIMSAGRNVTIGAVEKTAPIARTVLNAILVNVARIINVTRNVPTAAVEKIAIFALIVRSVTLVNAVKIATVLRNAQMVDVEKTATLALPVCNVTLESAVKMAIAERNAQMAAVEKTATPAHPVRSAILMSVATRITPVGPSVLIPASLGQQLQGLLSPV